MGVKACVFIWIYVNSVIMDWAFVKAVLVQQHWREISDFK